MLKRLFEYSNIFEQGFQNEYSNTKIENRVFEKVMNRAPSTMCKPSAAPACWGPPRRLHLELTQLIKPVIIEREPRCAARTSDHAK